MQKIRLSVLSLLCCSLLEVLYAQKQRDFQLVTIAFYNLENLFDTENDLITFDDDRTPDGKDHWTPEIYADKLAKMAEVLRQIGPDETTDPPALIGVAEIENRKVLEALVTQSSLKAFDYGIVHYDSPDRRGVDVALLYRKSLFKPVNSKAFELPLYDPEENNKRLYTRDQLLVGGDLAGERVHILVNHWPSRSGGEERTRPRREAAAALNRKIIDSILSVEPYAKLVSMGDLNDDPKDSSLKKVLKTKGKIKQTGMLDLYNPMEELAKQGLGSLAYRDSWNLFDQIILSAAWLERDYNGFSFYKAGIFNKKFLQTPSGPFKGYPFRSFANGSYTGGYSDHFPVYVCFVREFRK